MKAKRVLVVIICLCMFLLCGCTVPTQYTLEQKENGEVTQTIYVPFSVQELAEYGIESSTARGIGDEVKNRIDEKFENRYQIFLAKLASDDGLTDDDKNLLESFCPTQEDMYGKGRLFGNSTSTGITYEFKFKNALAYYYFNTDYKYDELIQELKKDDAKIVHNFLTTDKIYTNKTIFSVNVEYATTMSFAKYLNTISRDILKKELKDNTILTDEQKEKIYNEIPPKDFLYRYGTSSRRLHSDADQIRNINGMYYHEWNMSIDNADREISTWNTYANAKVWYALALIITIVLVVVLMLIYGNDNKKVSKNGL